MGLTQSKEDFVFSKEELKILLKNFKQLDKDNSGFIEPNELFDHPDLKDNPIVQRIICVFDENIDGCISFYEFVNGLTALTSGSNPVDKYKFAFKIYDYNQDGEISNGDLFHVIKLLVKDTLPDIYIQQIVDRTMQAADIDHDGVLSFEEFILFVQSSNLEELFTMKALEDIRQ